MASAASAIRPSQVVSATFRPCSAARIRRRRFRPSSRSRIVIPGTLSEIPPIPVDGGTLLSLFITCIVITWPSSVMLDTLLGTGMTDVLAASYLRLEAGCAGGAGGLTAQPWGGWRRLMRTRSGA